MARVVGLTVFLLGFITAQELIWALTEGKGRAFSIASDSQFLYVVGSDESLSDIRWKVVKLDKDGNFIWKITINPTPGEDIPYISPLMRNTLILLVLMVPSDGTLSS